MEEIKVGDYIRTEDGIIDRIVIAENDDEMYAGERDPEYLDYVREDITKHSSNIIDLIENGDFIFYTDEDGEKVKYIITIDFDRLDDLKEYLKKYCTIKSIVTKEQFANIEYKVEE